jgi:hypothetical protein
MVLPGVAANGPSRDRKSTSRNMAQGRRRTQGEVRTRSSCASTALREVCHYIYGSMVGCIFGQRDVYLYRTSVIPKNLVQPVSDSVGATTSATIPAVRFPAAFDSGIMLSPLPHLSFLRVGSLPPSHRASPSLSPFFFSLTVCTAPSP